MPDTVEVPAQPVAPATNAADNKGGENVGIAQAVNRMLKSEQARETAKAEPPADTIIPAETATATPPATETAEATSAEVTPAEVEAQAETPEGETEDAALSHEEHSLDPKLQEKINRRIGKEVAKRKALEAQVNELKVQMQAQVMQPPQTQQTVVPLPQGASPLANIEDSGGLVALQQQAKEAKRWAQEQLDEGSNEVQLGDKILQPKDLKAIIRNANRTLEDDIPSRAQFLQQREQVRQVAYKEFPYLVDKSSPDYVAAQAAYQAMPWLRNLPNADWIIGVQIEGLKARAAKQAAADKTKAKTPVKTANPPSAQTAVSSNGSVSRVATGTRNQQEISAIRQSLSKKGNVTANDAIAALTKIEQLKHR